MSEKKLNELKGKVTELQEELMELTPEELEKVTGGAASVAVGLFASIGEKPKVTPFIAGNDTRIADN